MRYFAGPASAIAESLANQNIRQAQSYAIGAAAPQDLFPGPVVGDTLAMRRVTRQETVVELLPRTQFLVIVRDPVQRAISQYLYTRGETVATPEDFDEVINRGLDIMRFCRYPPSCICFWNSAVRILLAHPLLCFLKKTTAADR